MENMTKFIVSSSQKQTNNKIIARESWYNNV